MASYELKELIEWDARIRDKVAQFGLDCFDQEFEICDHAGMLGYMAYSGMPSHYPHWSYGKAYEKLKTLYDHGVTGLPYEMVINANPAIAYLMRDNTLLLQVLTIAHVYGHNDFFKNNYTFRTTKPALTVELFKAHALRLRRYVEDPSIGIDKVERLLDAAHALAYQCRRNLAIRKLDRREQETRLIEQAQPRHDPFRQLHQRVVPPEPDLNRVPLEPDEDLLLFIRDHNPRLADWEKDVLTILDQEAKYFLPMIETKIMNEGWASYWHKRVLEALALDQGLSLEFIVRHNQVLRPIPGQINPYRLGFKVWEDIYRRHTDPTPEEVRKYGAPTKSGIEKLFEAREVERDTSFLRRYLTEELMRELGLFEFEANGEDLVVSRVSDEEGWRAVKETLIKNQGSGSIPVVKVEDADFGQSRTLYLKHYHDGRDLQLEYAEKTLAYVFRLWERECVLETVLQGRRSILCYNDRGFSMRALK
ncbi:MAG: SpoVR family protein [Deltaproteobacteria bacterium]|jgi:stage V sporulation protein R|nr:SpoVR family protein [Deltaproteobacteria bacterium]